MSSPTSRPAVEIKNAPCSKRPLIIPIFIPHMGCPHQCLFCNQNSITSQPNRLPSFEYISRQIENYCNYSRRRSLTELSFYGGNFLGLSFEQIKSLLSQVSPFIQKGMIDGIRFSTRPDTIDSERLELIAPFPVSTVEIGVQTMNDSILATARRGHKSEDTRSAVALLKQTDYTIGLQLMVGLPGETFENLIQSAHRIAALQPDFVRIYPTLVIKGSPLARWYQNGKYIPLSLSQAVEHTKKLFLLFHQKKISVIRMGLQASEELDRDDTILAGPYHPAFGHMVHASIFLDAMRRMLSLKLPSLNSDIQISASPKDTSKAQGLNNRNLQLLKKEFKLDHLKISPDPALPPNTLCMENGECISVF